MGGVQHFLISADEDGMRLDRWFRLHYPALRFGNLQKLLRTGQIRVEGARAKGNTRLTEGWKVRVPPLPPGGEAAAAPKKNTQGVSARDREFVRSLILHKDEQIIVLNKPPGLAVQGGSNTARHLDGLLDGLQFKAAERPRLVHRLDKDTSGVMLLARSRQAAAFVGKALKAQEARKIYWAMVIGVPRPAAGLIDMPLVKKGRSGSERVEKAGADDAGGKTARTRFEVIEAAGRRLSWLAMMPLTGRTHQLRAHAAAIGHAVVGDGKYGGPEAHPGGGLSRMLHLHAKSIEIAHPDGGRLMVDAPLPAHMAASWDFLGFDARAETRPFADEV